MQTLETGPILGSIFSRNGQDANVRIICRDNFQLTIFDSIEREFHIALAPQNPNVANQDVVERESRRGPANF